MYDTPVVAPILRLLAIVVLKLAGWKIKGTLPSAPKFVLVAAPHTSYWDGFYLMAVAFVFRVKLRWMGKHTLFRKPMGPIIRWLGGIPINRTISSDTVKQAVEAINESNSIVLAIPPEGTRQRVSTLKTGFYYIALEAKIPIVMGILDYGRKITGVGPLLNPSGDLEADLETIRSFYADIAGKYKDQSALTQVGEINGADNLSSLKN